MLHKKALENIMLYKDNKEKEYKKITKFIDDIIIKNEEKITNLIEKESIEGWKYARFELGTFNSDYFGDHLNKIEDYKPTINFLDGFDLSILSYIGLCSIKERECAIKLDICWK